MEVRMESLDHLDLGSTRNYPGDFIQGDASLDHLDLGSTRN